MMGELREEMAEKQAKETKAEAAEKLCVLLNNAIGFMLESGMSEEDAFWYATAMSGKDLAVNFITFPNIEKVK